MNPTLNGHAHLVDRVPPQSIEMEQATLGSMITERIAIDRAYPIVQPADFYRLEHRTIYEAILSLTEQDEPIDFLSIQEELRRNGQLENCGGASYLVQLTNAMPTAAAVEHYAEIVANNAMRRRLLQASYDLLSIAHEEEDGTIQSACESVIQSVFTQSNWSGQGRDMREVLDSVWVELERRSEAKDDMFGLPTGIPRLDRMTAGLKPGALYVIAARPGGGKTTLGMQIAAHVAKFGHKVAVFTMEMNAEEIVLRWLSGDARIDNLLLSRAKFDSYGQDWKKLGISCARANELPIKMFETPSVTIPSIRANLRQMRARYGLDFVVVDYIGLAKGIGKFQTRAQEVGEISRGLKGIAKEFKVPVVAMAQLNRGSMNRSEQAPELHDLRDSGDIEQDADCVIMLHRPHKGEEDVPDPEETDLFIRKQRSGPEGYVPMLFFKSITRFEERAQ